MRRVHEGISSPWECETCGKGFTRKASLEEHQDRHTGVKQKYCEKCDKHFYQTAYWRHLTTVHPIKERLRHACPHCDKAMLFNHVVQLQ